MVDERKSTIEFDIVIPTPKGCIYCVNLRRDTEITGATSDTSINKTKDQDEVKEKLAENNAKVEKIVENAEYTDDDGDDEEVESMEEEVIEKMAKDTNTGVGPTTKVGEGDMHELVDESSDDDIGNTNENNDEIKDLDDNKWIKTRSGRTVKPPRRFIEDIGENSIGAEKAETNYYSILEDGAEDDLNDDDTTCVEGSGFQNIQELSVRKFNETMASENREKWKDSVDEEHNRMIERNVLVPVPKHEVPKDAKVVTPAWTMKTKSSRVYRARPTVRNLTVWKPGETKCSDIYTKKLPHAKFEQKAQAYVGVDKYMSK